MNHDWAELTGLFSMGISLWGTVRLDGDSFTVTEYDELGEAVETFSVPTGKLSKVLLNLDGYELPIHLRELLGDYRNPDWLLRMDATAADVWFQLAAFDQLVYA